MLSKRTKYAINALVYIAKNKDSKPLSVSRIAESQNIPLKFLESILVDLKNARILNSSRGKYGGYSLNKKPSEINLAEIARLFDGAIALLPCVTYQYYERCEECPDENICGIREVFSEIRKETVIRLKAATLSNIIERERKKKK